MFLLALPSACGLFLEDYRIDDSKLQGAACQLGEQRCVGDWLVGCAATLDGWVDKAACTSLDRCDSGAGSCAACGTGEYRCEGSVLQVCNAARTGWDSVETCAAGVTCNVNLQACAACSPNEYQCNGAVLSQCNAQGAFGSPTQCGSAELCNVSEDRLTGRCQASAMCQAGKYACDGARLVRCDAQGVAWLGISTCASATLCNQGLAAAGSADKLPSCVRPSCEANQARCDGNQVMVCSPERTGFMPGATCTADNPCNQKLGGCGRCTVGEKHCSGADLLSCDSNGVFQKVQTCGSAALCDADKGTCNQPECNDPGGASCDPIEPLLVQCGDDLTERVTSCGTSALCNARDGRCETPRCESPGQRCDGNRLQHCNAEQTGWETDLTCDAGSYCDTATKACKPGACTANSYRCNDVFLERCGAKGFERVARCAVAKLCHADTGKCETPECAPGTFLCVSQTGSTFLKKCGAERKWIDTDVCTGQCDDIGGKCL